MRRAQYHNVAMPMQDQWPIKKALTSSDVDITHPFLTLARQPVETHIVVYLTQQEQEYLRNEGQVDVSAQDDDTGEMYAMRLRWRGSYFILIGKWGKVVREKGLEVGREIKVRWANGCLHFSVPQQQIVAVPPSRVARVQDRWPIKKVLTLSDVDASHPFLPLPRRLVENHILVHWTQQQRQQLKNDEQVIVNAQDYETGDIYVMKLKLQGNYYNLIGKWGTIIRQKGLGLRKEIKLRWANECLYFSVPQERFATAAQGQQRVAAPAQGQQRLASTAQGQDDWPIKKALTLSDVDTNHPFLTLPGKAVEDHILLYWTQQAQELLRNEHQINVNARDDDTGDLYLMKLKWRGSYYNLIGKWGKIIRGKNLHVGQEIRVRWDNGYLIFSVPQ